MQDKGRPGGLSVLYVLPVNENGEWLGGLVVGKDISIGSAFQFVASVRRHPYRFGAQSLAHQSNHEDVAQQHRLG